MKRPQDHGTTQPPDIPRPFTSQTSPTHAKVKNPIPASAPEHAEISTASTSPSSSFRNVSACNRCRMRKNRCDQQLPSCGACEKVGAECVGYDPITKKEIPRSYIFYLESRTAYLESVLKSNGIPFAPAEAFTLGPLPQPTLPADESSEPKTNIISESERLSTISATREEAKAVSRKAETVDNLVSNIGLAAEQISTDPGHLDSASNLSFARIVLAAVNHSVKSMSRAASEKADAKPANLVDINTATGPSARDSFFGLQTKLTAREAPFPKRQLGLKLVNLYFEHANPQIPILHRPEFMKLFERVYGQSSWQRTAREAYLLNIVFAIGSGIIMKPTGSGKDRPSSSRSSDQESAHQSNKKKPKLSKEQDEPEEYHAAAIAHLRDFLGSAGQSEGLGGGLEELQAVLLLASFALLRPVPPGLWYIVGVAVKLALDLGLHYEEGGSIGSSDAGGKGHEDMEGTTDNGTAVSVSKPSKEEQGRREWVRDHRRRLWWSVYSFDRLVSFCVGRPVGFSDQVVTTDFPSLLDDEFITVEGFTYKPKGLEEPSYKRITHHYLRLRLLQSEIIQVLQYVAAQRFHSRTETPNPFMYIDLPSPFLSKFRSFNEWRKDMDARLWEWKESSPAQKDTGVEFNTLFFELNHWQAVIALYRQSSTIPSHFAEPTGLYNEDSGDEEHIHLTMAEAGQRVMKLYRQLHRLQLVNYTFLATHHLFLAGISFLSAIWYSSAVRARLTLDDVDFTVLAATSVFEDLSDICPPAETCREAFSRISKATIQHVLSTTGFATTNTDLTGAARSSISSEDQLLKRDRSDSSGSEERVATNPLFPVASRRPRPTFNADFKDLCPENELGPFARRLSVQLKQQQHRLPPQQEANKISSDHSQDDQRFHGSTDKSAFAQVAPSQLQQQTQIPSTTLDITPIQPQTQPKYSTFGSPAQSLAYVSAMDELNDLEFLNAFAQSGRPDWANNTSDNFSIANMNMFGIANLDGNHDWMNPSGAPELMPWDGFFFRS